MSYKLSLAVRKKRGQVFAEIVAHALELAFGPSNESPQSRMDKQKNLAEKLTTGKQGSIQYDLNTDGYITVTVHISHKDPDRSPGIGYSIRETIAERFSDNEAMAFAKSLELELKASTQLWKS